MVKKINNQVLKKWVLNFILLVFVIFLAGCGEPEKLRIVSSSEYCVKRDYDTGLCVHKVVRETWKWSDGSLRTEERNK